MAKRCPNINHPDWKLMVEHLGFDTALLVYDNNEQQIPIISVGFQGEENLLFMRIAKTDGVKTAVDAMVYMNSVEFRAKNGDWLHEGKIPEEVTIDDLVEKQKEEEVKEEIKEEEPEKITNEERFKKNQEQNPEIKFQKKDYKIQSLYNFLSSTYDMYRGWISGLTKEDIELLNQKINNLGFSGQYYVKATTTGKYYIAGYKNQNIFDDNYWEPYTQKPTNEFAELAKGNEEVQEFIRDKFQKLYPGVNIFANREDFLQFIQKTFGDISEMDLDVIGAAFANAVYIDENEAQQDTFFHEHSHLYWSALPEDMPIKKRLLEMFDKEEDPEEAAIQFIGTIGTEMAETEYEGTWLDKAKNLARIFWARVKNFFGKANVRDLSAIMASDIWNNRAKLKVSDFVEKQMKNQRKSNDTQQAYRDDGSDKTIYTTDGKPVLSVTKAINSLKKKKFDREEQVAMQIINIEKNKDPNYAEYFNDDKSKLVNRKGLRLKLLEEWDLKAKIGSDIHKMAEMIVNGETVPDAIKQRFAPGVYEEYEKQIKAFIEKKKKEYDEVESEKLVYSEEVGMGGIIDLTGKDKTTGNYHIWDFKTFSDSPFDEDGNRTDDYVKGFGLTLSSPFHDIIDSKYYNHSLQLNFYNAILRKESGLEVESMHVIPIVYDIDKKGKIISTNIEKEIKCGDARNSVENFISWATGKYQQSLNSGNTYVFDNPLMKKNYETAANRLNIQLPEGVTIGSMAFEQGMQLLNNSHMDPNQSLQERGWSVEEINAMPLDQKLRYHMNPKLVRPEVWTVGQMDTEYDPELTLNTLKEFSQDNLAYKKYEEDLAEYKEILKKIDSIESAMRLTYDQLTKYEERLRTMDPMMVGNLHLFLSNIISNRVLVQQVIDENKDGSKEVPIATIVMEHINENGYSSLQFLDMKSFLGQYPFMNSRMFNFNTSPEIAYLISNIRREQNKIHDAQMTIDDEFSKVNFNDVDFKKISKKIGRGTYFINETDPKYEYINAEEKKLIDLMTKKYAQFDSEYRATLKYKKELEAQGEDSSYVVLPEIPVPQAEASWWQIMWNEKTFWAIKLWRYAKPSKYDNVFIEREGMKMSFNDYKRYLSDNRKDYNNYALAKELKSAYKEAKKAYNSDKTSQAIEGLQSSDMTKQKIGVFGNNNSTYNMFKNSDDKMVIKEHLKSKANKYHMDKVIPFGNAMFSLIKGRANLGHLYNFASKYYNKQVFGKYEETHFAEKARKWVNALMVMTAYKSLVWNPIAQAVNFSIGQIQNIIHSKSKDKGKVLNFLLFWTPDSYAVGVYRMIKHAKKCYHIMKRMKLVDITQDDRYDGIDKVKKGLERFAFLLTEIVENANHGVAFIGMMSQEEFDSYDVKGRVKSLENNFSQKEVDKANKNKLTDIKVERLKFETNMIHGDYGTENTAIWSYSVGGMMFMQFKRWLPAFIMARVGNSYIDINGNHQRGYYGSAMALMYAMSTHLKTKESQKKLYNDTLKMSDRELSEKLNMVINEIGTGKIPINKLPQKDKQNLVKLVREVTIILALYTMFIRTDDDDEPESKMYKWFKKNYIDRLWQDAIYIWDLNTWKGQLGNLIPVVKYTSDLFELLGQIILVTTEEIKDVPKEERQSIYQKNYPPYGKKDELKIINRFLKIVPAGSGFYHTKQFLEASNDEHETQKQSNIKKHNDSFNANLETMDMPEFDTSAMEIPEME